jgi:hypothetical protein
MLRKNSHLLRHPSDEHLVRSADGELSSKQAADVNAHLEACWDCRARMEEIQTTITGFVRAYHAEYDGQLPPAAGPRALLRARLAELASESPFGRWRHVLHFGTARATVVLVPLVALAIGVVWYLHTSQRNFSVRLDAGVAPNHALTPGATRQVAISEVCSVPREEVIEDVSISLRQKVFQEYGIANARPEDYEIDYLIAPHLGGAEDIRNLWPEPYRTRMWNAHVKDDLEERLHEMVCSGQLDLPTAQHEIATDWIAAYKRYFHTDQPLTLHSHVNGANLIRFIRTMWAYSDQHSRTNRVSIGDYDSVFSVM